MATAGEVRERLAHTSVPPGYADRLVGTASSLWLASDGPTVLAGDLALCHPPLGPCEVRAAATPSDDGRGWRLTVVAHDRPGLLADTAAALAGQGLSVSEASVVTWDGLGLALHALTLPGALPSPAAMDRLGRRLRSAATGGEVPVPFVPGGRAEVRAMGEAEGDRLVTVTAPDQLGLLWAVCRWLADHGASIQAAWVSGTGGMAHDIFLVRGAVDLDALAALLRGRPKGLPARVAGRAGEVLSSAARAGRAAPLSFGHRGRGTA